VLSIAVQYTDKANGRKVGPEHLSLTEYLLAYVEQTHSKIEVKSLCYSLKYGRTYYNIT